ncbi:nucleotidyltransferase domain-containing protein [Actinospica durhamensis]|uniref:Nucleotidyltransferase domain-containing protein n=1 Tax=Actinospica durhamensis TaxID=1508375 RepID=A0A941EIW7_9ACTN|nr:nucleotidyltransferase domain-containing protein [Actinospica durhamensis]MBR7833345.1 nucleotidyltransferase domain-containing protein [Actinospica durhamensis]
MNVLLSGIVGSTAYGLAGPDSDVDRLGMFALPTIELVGLDKPRLSIVGRNPDVAWHEAGKAVSLVLAGNPTTMELLWLPEDLYEVRTPLGDEAIALRARFLCAHRAKEAYLGYATQQFKKLLAQAGVQPRPARTAKHARHLMRLVEQGYELYTTGTVRIRLEDPQRLLDFGAAVAEDPQRAVPFMAEAEDRFNRARTVLADEPDYDAAQDWLLRVRRAFWDWERRD